MRLGERFHQGGRVYGTPGAYMKRGVGLSKINLMESR